MSSVNGSNPAQSDTRASHRWHRLLLTGAGGNLGRVLRPTLAASCDVLRVSDATSIEVELPNEQAQVALLEDKAAMVALLNGVDAVVHMGGVSQERPFEAVLTANIIGVFHLYEAARINKVKRIIFASSNHVTGCYEQTERIDTNCKPRPDGYYGVSKAFGENLAQLYWDRYAIETVSMRIGSACSEPLDRRMLSTWLSFPDLAKLVTASLTAPFVGHTVVYGCSNNPAAWWNNEPAKHLGFEPTDSSEVYRERIESKLPGGSAGSAPSKFQGGLFLEIGPF